jgi:uncharacterized protein YegL
MSRLAKIHGPVFVSLALTCVAAAWGGCAEPSGETSSSTSTTTSTTGSGGSGGTGGSGGLDGGTGTGGEEACTSVSAEAHRVPLDIIFLIDQSGSMTGAKWVGTKMAMGTFCNDPASAGVGVGLVLFPTQEPYDCNPQHYAVLDVPIDALPSNAFAVTNALPFDATGIGTPTYGALKGALQAATAYQDSHPTHKVIVVLATDGDPIGCMDKPISEIAALAESALGYNGVRTYVIGVAGSKISNLDQIAKAGGTVASYDITQDINEFSAKMAEIRGVALGCDFEIPPSPDGMQIDYERVNFTYTPKGVGTPKLLPRADDLADCGGLPGWYYDDNEGPSKLILCPASCATVQADTNAKVNVLFGCLTILN